MNQASIFTLDKVGNAYKDFDKFPQDLYIDTGAWLYSNNNMIYNPIREFMADCLNNGTIFYHSEMVLSEIVHVNEKSFYDQHADKYKPKARNYDGSINQKKLKELIRQNYPKIQKDIKESQDNLIHNIQMVSEMLEYEGNMEYFDELIKIREASGNILGVNDAKHVYIARLYGINSFLTTDGDFTALNNDNIYVLSNEKYKKERIGRDNVFLEFDSTQY